MALFDMMTELPSIHTLVVSVPWSRADIVSLLPPLQALRTVQIILTSDHSRVVRYESLLTSLVGPGWSTRDSVPGDGSYLVP